MSDSVPEAFPARRAVVGAAGAIGVAAVLVAVVARHRDEVVTALNAAPVPVLVGAAALQLVALVARSGAWWVCVDAAGGTVGRRPLFRAASLGHLPSQLNRPLRAGSVAYPATQLNSQLGAAARIGALRRPAPDAAPRVPALVAAEMPILLAEGALAAVASVTLIGPLGLPWWVPVGCLAVAAVVTVALQDQCRRCDHGFRSGLAVLGSMGARARMLGFVLVAVFAQITRNWLMLRAVGVDANVFDATAVLIAMVTLSQLPVGPSVGAAATVLILGANGPAAAAAAGVLLTATGTAGALVYVAWAGLDRLWTARERPARSKRGTARTWRRPAPLPV